MNHTIITKSEFIDSYSMELFYDELKQLPKDWWNISLYPGNSNDDVCYFRDFLDIAENAEYQKCLEHNSDSFCKNQFTYRFKRTFKDHYPTCICIVCKMRKLFESEYMRDILSSMVGEPVLRMDETFFSKYEQGDYLSIHHDKGKGDYAFILQFTKDWNPVNGGLLHFCDKDHKIYRTISPEFNSITIFKIKNTEITNHFVSRVSGSSARYAYTGWFSTA